jgi:hypothetical protein
MDTLDLLKVNSEDWDDAWSTATNNQVIILYNLIYTY